MRKCNETADQKLYLGTLSIYFSLGEQHFHQSFHKKNNTTIDHFVFSAEFMSSRRGGSVTFEHEMVAHTCMH